MIPKCNFSFPGYQKYVHEVRYDYKLFPIEANTYELSIRLPFDGTQMITGSEENLTVLAPKQITNRPLMLQKESMKRELCSNREYLK
ncbi:hypothetical protein UACE39S_02407 [Ureibacillus acetophenoni]